jgi:recombinational DNA repair protein (RecF pathway)
VRDGDPHPALYDGLVGCLRALEHGESVPGAVLWFQWLTLSQLGVAPELTIDARTQTPLTPAESYGFAPGLGGLVKDASGRHAEPADPREGAGVVVWRVRAETVAMLRALAEAQRSAATPGEVGLLASEAATVTRGNRLLARYLRAVLGHWPASARATFPGLVESEA